MFKVLAVGHGRPGRDHAECRGRFLSCLRRAGGALVTPLRRNLIVSLVLAAVAVLASGVVLGSTLIGVNFVGKASYTPSMGPAEQAGALPQSHWNNAVGGSGSGAALFPPGDWAALADFLTAGPLSRPPGERVAYPTEVVSRYSTTAAAERLAAAYERVLADRDGSYTVLPATSA